MSASSVNHPSLGVEEERDDVPDGFLIDSRCLFYHRIAVNIADLIFCRCQLQRRDNGPQ